MTTARLLTHRDVALHDGILVLIGYGIRVAVERGHLVVEDGVGADRRRDTFSRVDRDLKRVTVIGHAGLITLDAIHWLHGVGVPLVHLSSDGTLYLVAAPSAPSAPALRRNQARALGASTGLEIARELLTAKIRGQLSVLDRLAHSDDAKRFLTHDLEQAARSRTLTDLRRYEAHAARAYWRPWRSVRLQIDRDAARRRPRHWNMFGTRISPLTDPSPRKAVNPANAILNYLYAILEAEARVAALSVGLDPSLGLIHTDRPNRDSLASDLMEPVRPAVDRFLLDYFASRAIGTEDVFELLSGQCRLLPPVTTELAQTAASWAGMVRHVAEYVAATLGGDRRTTHVTSLGDVKPDPRRSKRRPRGKAEVVRGFVLGHEVTQQESASPLARRLRLVLAANRDWERENGRPDPAVFRDEILGSLKGVPLRLMEAATGLSRIRCSQIRRGQVLPHPRHWEALRRLGPRTVSGPADCRGRIGVPSR